MTILLTTRTTIFSIIAVVGILLTNAISIPIVRADEREASTGNSDTSITSIAGGDDDDIVYDDIVYDDIVYDDIVYDDNVFDDFVFDDYVFDDYVGDNNVGDDNVGDDYVFDDFVFDDYVFDDYIGDDNVGDDNVGDDNVGDSGGDAFIFDSKENPWIAPDLDIGGDERSPDRLINALANHGIIDRTGRNIDLFDFAEKMENIYGLSKEYIYLTKLLTIIDCGQTYEDENGIIRFNLYDLFESGCEDLRSILVTMDVNATSTTAVNQTLLDELLMMNTTSNSTGNDDNIITLEDLAIFGYGRIFDIYNNKIIDNGNENYTILGSEFIAVELLSLGLIGTNPNLTTIETDRLNDFLLYERLPENYTLLRPKLPYNFLLANDPTYPLFFDCK